MGTAYARRRRTWSSGSRSPTKCRAGKAAWLGTPCQDLLRYLTQGTVQAGGNKYRFQWQPLVASLFLGTSGQGGPLTVTRGDGGEMNI
jgi:hypothetical protein